MKIYIELHLISLLIMKLLQIRMTRKISYFNINCMAINYSDGRSTGMYTYNIQANFIRPIKFNYNGTS